ncbi:MAG: preprotein translocase subunit SecY [Acidimicrobiia bacterium]|jgi:preprotein translocase subunit SecY|nr:MAG: preprotein translocase subunit SecY [Acidimicrobiia bacterium]
MLAVYRHMFTIPDLRRKILFTLFIFFVYRLGATIVVPGINLDRLGELADLADQGGVVGLLNLFSGGGLENFSVLGLGIMPYITASIIMQLLAVVIPRLQALQEEGDAGRKVITQWTRYLTVILALIQSTTISYLAAQGSSLFGGISLIPDYSPGKALLIILTMTAGTSFVMWLGELITQRGIGNGMSLLIFISIISQLPGQFTGIYQFTASAGDWERFAIFIVAFLLMIVAILYVDQGQRRIPIQFAKRVRGRRVMGGGNTYIPLKVNTAGVIPVIFATSVLIFPALLTTLIPSNAGWLESVRDWVNTNFGFGTGSTWTYIIGLFLLIVFFTYFYTAIQFDPAKQADSIQRQGGFIPGVRPGRQTEAHLAHILNRITLPGALFLGGISILPSILSNIWDIPIGFSGVSVLIVVGVALETMKQIESQLTMRNYEGFLT